MRFKNEIYKDCKNEKEKDKVYYNKRKEELKLKAYQNSGGVGEYNLFNLKKKLKADCNFTCQRCHQQFEGYRLHVHHIEPTTENYRNDDESNLVVLCNSCHQKLHNILSEPDCGNIAAITKDFINGDILSNKEIKERKKQENAAKRNLKAKERKEIKDKILEHRQVIKDYQNKIAELRVMAKKEKANRNLDRWRRWLDKIADFELLIKWRRDDIKKLQNKL